MSAMTRTCPSCQKLIAVPPEAVGKKVRCSGCQAVFRIEEVGAALASMSIEAPVPSDLPKPAPEPPPEPPPEPAQSEAPNFDFGDAPSGFEQESKLDFNEQESKLDFSEDEPQLNAGVRLRVSRLANRLTLGGAMTICLAVCVIMRGFTIFGRTGMIAQFFGAVAAASIFITFAVFILIGAQSFARLRSKGLAMTGAALALVAAVPGMFGCISVASAFLGSFDRDMPMLVALCLGVTTVIQVPSCLWGGIGTFFFINLPELGEAFQQERERQRRVAGRSGEFVAENAMRESSLHAAMWMGGLCLAIITLIVLRIVMLWRLSALNQAGENAWMFTSVASAILILFMIGIIVGAVSLHLRQTPILSYLGSGLCILMAMLSFCGTFFSIANIATAQDTIVRQLGGASVFVSIVMLVLSVICALVGFSASNLLVRYRGALGKQAETKVEGEAN